MAPDAVVRRTIWGMGVAVVLLGAWPALLFMRGYRAEHSVLVPRQGPVPMPADLRALGFAVRRISTRQGSVAGWFLPPNGGATVILCHGSNADRTTLLDEVRALVAAGHGVWMFDWPGHGESDGRVDFGLGSQQALQTIVDTVATWHAVDATRLGLYAFSMGGVSAVPVAATERRLRALVIVSTPVDMDRQLTYEYASAGRITTIGASFFWRTKGVSLRALNILPSAERLGPRPVIVVAGDSDRSVSPSDGMVLTQAIGPTAALWTIHGATHGGYIQADATFATRVAAFFSRALAPPPAADAHKYSSHRR